MDSSSTTFPTSDAIKAALAEINVNVKDITSQSNISAFVTFDTLHRVSP
jgi:predicted amino acid-binding ACT domain protein